MISTNKNHDSVSPKEFGKAIGVSESTLKRWIDSGSIKAHKTVGGHRRILIKDALLFARSKSLNIVDSSPLKLNIDSNQISMEECKKLFLNFLRDGKAEDAKNLLFSQFINGTSISQIGDGPIKDALQFISNNDGIYTDNLILEEHRATQICIRIIDYLHEFVTSSNPKFKSVGGAIVGDYYSLPSMLVAAVVSENNGLAVNLGPNTPFGVFRSASIYLDKAIRPDVVWISLSTIKEITNVSSEINKFAHECHSLGIKLIVGGRAAKDLLIDDTSLIKIHDSLESISFEFIDKK